MHDSHQGEIHQLATPQSTPYGIVYANMLMGHYKSKVWRWPLFNHIHKVRISYEWLSPGLFYDIQNTLYSILEWPKIKCTQVRVNLNNIYIYFVMTKVEVKVLAYKKYSEKLCYLKISSITVTRVIKLLSDCTEALHMGKR